MILSRQTKPSFGASIPIENNFMGCRKGTFTVKELGFGKGNGYHNQNLRIHTALNDVEAVFEEKLHITLLSDVENLQVFLVDVARQVLICTHSSETNNPKR